MVDLVLSALTESIKITLLVLVMMILIDLINVWTRGKLSSILQTGRKWKQYVLASLLGASPGCIGSFAGVSLYVHGMISFGALTGMLLATAGDEQFVMLAMFPKTAIIIFIILFFIGIIAGVATDFIIKKFKIKTCSDCKEKQFHEDKEGISHYLKDHIWKHIIKKHIFKTFLWTFGAILILGIGLKFWEIDKLTSEYTFLILILSAVIGLIPESGPHLIFVTMYAQGLIPFSVLFTSSIVQDGHGMLPLLSFSVKDSLLVKTFNMVFGIGLGLIIYLMGY